MHHGFHKNFFFFFYIDIMSSCDTEDWSNDAENTALPAIKYKIYFKIYKQ